MTRRVRIGLFFLALLVAGGAAYLWAWMPRTFEDEMTFDGTCRVTSYHMIRVTGTLTNLRSEPVYETEVKAGYTENGIFIVMLIIQIGLVQAGETIYIDKTALLNSTFDVGVTLNWSCVVVGRDGTPSTSFLRSWLIFGGVGVGVLIVIDLRSRFVKKRQAPQRSTPPSIPMRGFEERGIISGLSARVKIPIVKTHLKQGYERLKGSLGSTSSFSPPKDIVEMSPVQNKLLDVFYGFAEQSEFTFQELASITGHEVGEIRLALANLIRIGKLSATLTGERLRRKATVVVSCQLCDQSFTDPMVYWQCPMCKRFTCQSCHEVQASSSCPNCQTSMVKLPALCPSCKTVYTKLDGFHDSACLNCRAPLWE